MFKRQSYHNEPTSEDCASWQRELAELKSNLRIIEERLSQFVMSTDPANLQLVKRKQELKAQIADLAERLATRCDEGQMTVRASAKSASPRAVLVKLRKTLGDRFSVGELRDLCFDLDVDYDDLPGKVKADKVRELLKYLERHNRIPELQRTGQRLRPDISWGDVPIVVSEEIDSPPLPPPSPSPPREPPPQINPGPQIRLTDQENTLLQRVHQGSHQVNIEKEFGGGYSGTRVLLTMPVADDGRRKARQVTKLGPAFELCKEWDNYEQRVKGYLPFCAAQVEKYAEQNDQAGLNYVFVGGGALGQALDLETYYRRRPVEQVVKTLEGLLDRELGHHWYSQATPLNCLFTAEYGRHLVEHLRLRLRPASSDALMPENHSWDTVPGYRRIDVNDIPHQYETIRPGTLLEIEGMVVVKIKHGLVKLQDPGGQGIIVRVALDPASNAASDLDVGSIVSARGEVIYNRRDRMTQIIRDAFPDLLSEIESESIELPSCEGTYPNPLLVYLKVLSNMLEGRRSYVHGDLHLRNVLVDETGKGWLIDFARVEQRHNLFDFVKLETYVRLMALATVRPSLSLDDYVQFEQSLADDTLGKRETGQTCPANRDLEFAHRVIRAVRGIARKYMGPNPDFRGEYFPALFLYCLAMTKYYREGNPQPTRLTFATACVLGRYVLGQDDEPRSSLQSLKGNGDPPATQLPLGSGNRWAVLVGVNEYEDEVNYRRLHVCVKDVQAIRQQFVAGGYDPARINMLADGVSGPPTRSFILATLQAVANATEPDDLLFFYYSGHGDEIGDESYLVARDGRRLVLGDTAVSVSRIKEIVAGASARAKVIVLDSCHAGAGIGVKGARPMSAEFIRRVFEEAEGLAILASCTQGQLSYEWRAQERSVFTHFLLEALEGAADRDGKGFVTVQDASRHVTNGVKLWASQNQISQTPTLQCAVAGDIVLARYR